MTKFKIRLITVLVIGIPAVILINYVAPISVIFTIPAWYAFEKYLTKKYRNE